jgi:hypothetical protein
MELASNELTAKATPNGLKGFCIRASYEGIGGFQAS